MAKILLALLLAANVGGGSFVTISIQPSSTDTGGTVETATPPLINIPPSTGAGMFVPSASTPLNIPPSSSAGSTPTVDPTKTIDDIINPVKTACTQCDAEFTPLATASDLGGKCEKIPAFTDCVNENCDQQNLQGQLKLASEECRADDDVLKKWATSALNEVECKITGTSNCSEEVKEVVTALSNGITKACTEVKAFTTCHDDNCEETYLYADIKEAFKEKCGSSIIQVSALALVLSLLLRFL